MRRSRQTSARCWARPEPVSWGYQLAHETKHCDLVVRAAGLQVLPVSSALCAQARSESPGALRGQAGRRIRCPTARPGASDSLICESCQAGHLRRRDALSRAKPTTSRGIRLREDLAACKG